MVMNKKLLCLKRSSLFGKKWSVKLAKRHKIEEFGPHANSETKWMKICWKLCQYCQKLANKFEQNKFENIKVRLKTTSLMADWQHFWYMFETDFL